MTGFGLEVLVERVSGGSGYGEDKVGGQGRSTHLMFLIYLSDKVGQLVLY